MRGNQCDLDVEYLLINGVRVPDTAVVFEKGVRDETVNEVCLAYQDMPQEFKDLMRLTGFNIYVTYSHDFNGILGYSSAGYYQFENGNVSKIEELPYVVISEESSHPYETTLHELYHSIDSSFATMVQGGEDLTYRISSTEKWEDLFKKYNGAIARLDGSAAVNAVRNEKEMLAETGRLFTAHRQKIERVAEPVCEYFSREVENIRRQCRSRLPELASCPKPKSKGYMFNETERNIIQYRKEIKESMDNFITAGDGGISAEEAEEFARISMRNGMTYYQDAGHFGNVSLIIGDIAFTDIMQPVVFNLPDGEKTMSVREFDKKTPESGFHNFLDFFEETKLPGDRTRVLTHCDYRERLVDVRLRKTRTEYGTYKKGLTFSRKDREWRKKLNRIYFKSRGASKGECAQLRKKMFAYMKEIEKQNGLSCATKYLYAAVRESIAAQEAKTRTEYCKTRVAFWNSQYTRSDERNKNRTVIKKGRHSVSIGFEKKKLLNALKHGKEDKAVSLSREYFRDACMCGDPVIVPYMDEMTARTAVVIADKCFDADLNPIIINCDGVQIWSLPEATVSELCGADTIANYREKIEEKVGIKEETRGRKIFATKEAVQNLGISQIFMTEPDTDGRHVQNEEEEFYEEPENSAAQIVYNKYYEEEFVVEDEIPVSAQEFDKVFEETETSHEQSSLNYDDMEL